MKKITTALLIFFAFALFSNNAKAQIEPPILTIEDLPYTLDLPEQIVGLDVNSDDVVDFAILFFNFEGANPEGSEPKGANPELFGSMFMCRPPHNGILSENETVNIPYKTIPELNNFPPLSDNPPGMETPYASLFSQGVRINNIPPSSESIWESQSALAGLPLSLSLYDNPPLESSYIDGSSSGYIGARYELDGEIYYGWIEISVDDSAPSITIESMSFEATPFQSSYTGSMSTVPIAFISSLMGFFAIGVGVYFRRKKK